MKRLVKTAVVLGATNAFLASGAIVAFGDWSTRSVPGAISAKVVAMPRAGRPSVLASGNGVRVSWKRSFIRPGAEVTAYLVTRRNVQGETHLVCRVAGTSCQDAVLPVGTWRYTVQAVQGARWVGQSGPGSAPVTVAAIPVSGSGLPGVTAVAGRPVIGPTPPEPGGPLPAETADPDPTPGKRTNPDPVPPTPTPTPTVSPEDPAPTPTPTPTPPVEVDPELPPGGLGSVGGE